MGSCLSKKSACAISSSTSPMAVPNPPEELRSEIQPEKKKAEEETVVKKEIFIIKHRRSHEIERQKSDEVKGEIEVVDKGKSVISNNGSCSGGGGGVAGAPVRTSICTKEEVDAILIQCGRLSRSSSAGKVAISSENGLRKYSGSKRSYDFDHENGKSDVVDGNDDAVARERETRRRERHSQSQGRRRTPSREREKDQASQRSGSRERGSGGGRRVSKSPGRRSESPITTANGSSANSNSSAATANSRPGKMVSVPATVSGGAEATMTSVKRIQVKRNVGDASAGTRTTASPRARSPARARASNENQNVNSTQQPISLSRSNSKKAEISPCRRNPLAEIDTNIISQTPIQKPNCEKGSENRISSTNQTNVAMNVISAGPENPKTTLTRSRSSRLSRDLDINPETLLNPNTSYTALLLEDIQNFHQKNTIAPPFTLPPCVSKACSILEAVADLNSSIGSNLSTSLTDSIPIRKKQDTKDPILESEVNGGDDLMQPSFHKYVTVRRGTSGEEEQQESSGSNSFVSSQQQWASSSCWEPNSAESTDRWTSSSRSVSRTNDADGGKKVVAQKNGIGRGRVGRDFGVGVASR